MCDCYQWWCIWVFGCVWGKGVHGWWYDTKKNSLPPPTILIRFAAFCFLVLNWLRREGKPSESRKIKFLARRSLKSPSSSFALLQVIKLLGEM